MGANEEKDRPPAAGLMIMTMASDSDGTLGGLAALSTPERLGNLFIGALCDAMRCSSDSACARRAPEDSETFFMVHRATAAQCCLRLHASGRIASLIGDSSLPCRASLKVNPSLILRSLGRWMSSGARILQQMGALLPALRFKG